MNLTIEIDDKAVRRVLDSVAGSLTDFSGEMKQVKKVLTAGVDAAFLHGEYTALAPKTVKARQRKARRTGKQPVAGFETPLREGDTLRKSLTQEGAENAIITSDGTEAFVGTSEPQARRLQEGDKGHNIPAREFLTITAREMEQSTDILARGISDRVMKRTL